MIFKRRESLNIFKYELIKAGSLPAWLFGLIRPLSVLGN
jgi:hypothetical protein